MIHKLDNKGGISSINGFRFEVLNRHLSCHYKALQIKSFTLAGESLNDLEDEKMKGIYGECQIHDDSSVISNANFHETKYSVHHRIPVVFIC
jgi:hypothetical protein